MSLIDDYIARQKALDDSMDRQIIVDIGGAEAHANIQFDGRINIPRGYYSQASARKLAEWIIRITT